MGNQPVALKGRDQGLDAAFNIGREGGICYGQKGQWGNKGPDTPVLGPPFNEALEQNNGPGKKDK